MPQHPSHHRRRRSPALFAALTALAVSACGATDDPPEVADATVVEEQVDEAKSDLVQMLEDRGLTSISSALADVDLSDLVGSPEFTFLAPSDAAFTDLSAEQLADLLASPEDIEATLRNHLVPERLDAAALADLETVTVASGNTYEVSDGGSGARIGETTVVEADLEVGGGIVHVVDQLLLPE